MTAMMKYISNSFFYIWELFLKKQEIIGMKKAAKELYRLGYLKEYQYLLKRIEKIEYTNKNL